MGAVEMNSPSPHCPLCGALHQPQEPHENTPQFRRGVLLREGRVATGYDLVAHTSGIIREAAMVATLQRLPALSLEVRHG